MVTQEWDVRFRVGPELVERVVCHPPNERVRCSQDRGAGGVFVMRAPCVREEVTGWDGDEASIREAKSPIVAPSDESLFDDAADAAGKRFVGDTEVARVFPPSSAEDVLKPVVNGSFGDAHTVPLAKTRPAGPIRFGNVAAGLNGRRKKPHTKRLRSRGCISPPCKALPIRQRLIRADWRT